MFKKGESGNLAGRPKGTPNKVNQEIREKINNFLENNFDNIQKDVKQLEPKDRIKFYIDLLSFGLPKLKNVDMELSSPNYITAIEFYNGEVREIAKSLEKDI